MSDQSAAHLARLATIDGPPLPLDARPACTSEPQTFFPYIGKGGDYTAPRRAKALCQACPWRVECFTFAADPANQVDSGIWAGLSFSRNSPDEKFIDAYRAAVWPTTPKENAA